MGEVGEEERGSRRVMKALSLVEGAGELIASGEKTLEIRRWKPEELPLRDLAIVENGRRLTRDEPFDPDGRVVAVVDVTGVRAWRPEDAEAAQSTWEEGWLAWELGSQIMYTYLCDPIIRIPSWGDLVCRSARSIPTQLLELGL
jgi:hypothetical protein